MKQKFNRIIAWHEKNLPAGLLYEPLPQIGVLIESLRKNGIEANITGKSVTLRIKPQQAKLTKELLKDYQLPCRVNIERARKPTRRYNNHFDFIKNYPVAKARTK